MYLQDKALQHRVGGRWLWNTGATLSAARTLWQSPMHTSVLGSKFVRSKQSCMDKKDGGHATSFMLAFRVGAHPNVRRFTLEVRQAFKRIEEILVRLCRSNPIRPPVLLQREADKCGMQAHGAIRRGQGDHNLNSMGHARPENKRAGSTCRAGENHAERR